MHTLSRIETLIEFKKITEYLLIEYYSKNEYLQAKCATTSACLILYLI